MGTGTQIIANGQRLAGQPYILGAKPRWDTIGPSDCSGLVTYACAGAGIAAPDGTVNQFPWCQNAGTLIPVAQAVATPGALLFIYLGGGGGDGGGNHVAVSRGDGTTIEARGTTFGVGNFTAFNRGWTHGALIPGINYTAPKQENDMATLVIADDGDIAVFITDGVVKSWVRNPVALNDLRNNLGVRAALDGSPIRLTRDAIDSLTTVGGSPVYPPGYSGPRTA